MAARFEQLIERHHDELYAYLWRLLGKERGSEATLEVEDLVQEVFMRAYQSYGRLRPDSNARAWLYKIATHCAWTGLRRVRQRRKKALELERAARQTGGSCGAAHLAPRVRALVGTLPARQQACVTLRYLQDLDYREIAALLNCSEASARANVYQAIRRLRAEMKEQP